MERLAGLHSKNYASIDLVYYTMQTLACRLLVIIGLSTELCNIVFASNDVDTTDNFNNGIPTRGNQKMQVNHC